MGEISGQWSSVYRKTVRLLVQPPGQVIPKTLKMVPAASLQVGLNLGGLLTQ